MRVCVKAFSIRYDVCWYDLKQLNFLNKREIFNEESVKSQTLFYYGLATLIWYTPPNMQHFSFT